MNLTVSHNVCITPNSQDKAIFYLTFLLPENVKSQDVYAPGDWLTIQPKNREEMVSVMLSLLNLEGNETIELRRPGLVTCREALMLHLELTQLNPAILNKLQRQFSLGSWSDRQAMMDYADGKDIVDLLEAFPVLKEQGIEFLELLSPLAPRYYSIASAPDKSNSVSILYKKVQYQNQGRQRFGVASCVSADAKEEMSFEVEFKSNPTFKLPNDLATPIIMIGAGTGLAPFIGFMQQRELESRVNKDCAENLLFFGETYQTTNCLFCDELDRWQSAGLVTVFYAFSRDQKEKQYVQHQIEKQSLRIWTLLNDGAHIYICGSQKTMAASVKETILNIFEKQGGLDSEAADAFWHTLRKQKRLQMDVY